MMKLKFKVGDIIIRIAPAKDIPINQGDLCEVIEVEEGTGFDILELLNLRTGKVYSRFSSRYFKISEPHIIDQVLNKYLDEKYR
jgi:hypothetical protein